MSGEAVSERVLALADDSAGAETAVRAATLIAAGLGLPLAILGVSRNAGEDAAIESALAAAYDYAKQRAPSVEAIRATGDLLEVATRRIAEAPTALVFAGAQPRSGAARTRIASSVWRLVKSLAPPVLVTPPGDFAPRRALFCTGGERYIEDGARFAARLAAALSASVTLFHVSPYLPAMYGDSMRRLGAEPSEFLATNSRIARNVRRQLEIFRAAGVEANLRLATGDVLSRVVEEIRRGGHDLLIVGSSPARGTLSTYMLGDLTRDIVGIAGLPFCVVRSTPPGLWRELWRSLKEGAASAAPDAAEKKPGGDSPST